MRKFYVRLPIDSKPFYLSEVGTNNIYYNYNDFHLSIKSGLVCIALILFAIVYCFYPTEQTVFKAYRVGFIIGAALRYWKGSSIKQYLRDCCVVVALPPELASSESFKFHMYIIFNSLMCMAGILFGLYATVSLMDKELSLPTYLLLITYTTILVILDGRSKRFKLKVFT